MRRKPGSLLPIELSILRAGVDLALRGTPQFHGYAMAKEIREREEMMRKILTDQQAVEKEIIEARQAQRHLSELAKRGEKSPKKPNQEASGLDTSL